MSVAISEKSRFYSSVFIDTFSFTFPVLISPSQLAVTGEDVESMLLENPYLWNEIKKHSQGTTTFKRDHVRKPLTFIENMNSIFNEFGLELTPNSSGKNGYRFSYAIRAIDYEKYSKPLGHLLWGGIRDKHGFDTMNVYFSGHGMRYLYLSETYTAFTDFLKSTNGSIRRVDLAIDDYQGVYGMEELLVMYDNDKIRSSTGSKPKLTQIGDFHSKYPNGDGRTLYFGSRQSAKFYRAYEKGKQLGESGSGWVRHELELKASKSFFIPLSVFDAPELYLRGSYICFDEIIDAVLSSPKGTSDKKITIQYLKNEQRCNLDHLVKYARLSYGKLMYYLSFDHSKEEIFDMLSEIGTPRRLQII